MSHGSPAHAGFERGPQLVWPANFLTNGDPVRADWDGTAEWTGNPELTLPIIFGFTMAEPVLVKEIAIISRQDDPKASLTDTLEFAKHGASLLGVEYRDENKNTVALTPNGSVKNNLVVWKYKFNPPVLMTGVNAIVEESPDGNTTPLTQIEAIGA